MTIHRFFVAEPILNDRFITLSLEISHQIANVLRLTIGGIIIVFDKQQTGYTLMLEEINKQAVKARIIKQSTNVAESSIFISLYQSLLPREKFEEVLQKGTEVGVSRFFPLETTRTIIKAKDIREEKLQRWQKITQEAAEQSERGVVPQVHQPLSFQDAIETSSKDGIVLIAWEEEKDNHPSVILNGMKNLILQRRSFAYAQDDNAVGKISIFIGPEGGFTQEEIDFAKTKGAQTVSLGPRILRSETAGVVLASLILFSFGDLDRSSI